MATGTGKTNTATAIIKMFLRLYNVKRVLFLVDRLELESRKLGYKRLVLKSDHERSTKALKEKVKEQINGSQIKETYLFQFFFKLIVNFL